MDGIEEIGCFKTIMDPYNGITIEANNLPNTKEEFKENIELLIDSVEKRRNLIWIYIDISKSDFIHIATSKGFFFHTCSENKILLVKRLKLNAIIPTAANHTLGVGAVVLNEKNEILVIKEKVFSIAFKLPGGHVDDGEMISNACEREVYEETGIEVKFNSIVSLSHLYPHQFHKSNLYVLCLAKPLTSKIDIKDTDEIVEAKWIDVNTYLEDETTMSFSKQLVKVALKQKGLALNKPDFLQNFKKNIELFFPIEK